MAYDVLDGTDQQNQLRSRIVVPMANPPRAIAAPMVDSGPAPQISSTPVIGGGMIAMPPSTPPMVIHAPSLDTPVQRAQSRYNELVNSGSGIDQIKSPLVRGIARAADITGAIAGSVFAPLRAAETYIPGTQEHHDYLVRRQEDRLAQAQAQAKEEAQTKLLDAQPALKQAALENQTLKTEGTIQHQQDQAQHYTDQIDTQLRQHGYKHDTNGQVVPLAYEEMSQDQQAVHDLKNAQQDQAAAQADLERSKNDPSSPIYRQAQERISVANRNASTAAERLGLSAQQFAMRSRGTDTDGVALPGAMIGEDGRPVGTSFQQNVRPTGTERNKADLANSAADQIADMKALVAKRQDVFGPLAGRTTEFKVWLGSQDPDAQRFRAARTIAGDHLAGVFGGRSEAALTAIDNAIGQFKDNPGAVQAGLDQLGKANVRFQKAGTVHTASSGASSQPTVIHARDPQGKLHEAPVGTPLPAGWKKE